jgi:uncharacterized protein DUF4440
MSDVKGELDAVLRQAADALRAGASAAQFSALLYAPEILVVGEGWPRSIRGAEAFLPELESLVRDWGPNPDLTFAIVDPVIAGADMATTCIDVHVEPRKAGAAAEKYRCMYAWKRSPAGWRVAAEMFTVGSY